MHPSLQRFWSGVKAELPILIGVSPFGMIYGVLAINGHIQASAAQAMSAIIFAGSSQFVTAQLAPLGAPGLVVILTVFVINLRHALYSASIAPYLKKLRPAWKFILAYLLTDEAYAVAITNYRDQEITIKHEIEPRPFEHWFFLGAGLALWTTWQISTAVGIFLGAIIPESWSLDFTLALTFIALVVPALKDRIGSVIPSMAGAALAAGIVALVTYAWPYKLGLLTAALVGITAGMLIEGLGKKP